MTGQIIICIFVILDIIATFVVGYVLECQIDILKKKIEGE